MPETRTFHIGDILSVTTERLVSPGHMSGVHEFLDFMTGEPLFTHQLPRACDECAPSLRKQFPDLAAIVPPEFDGKESVDRWLAQMVAEHGETREVAPLASEDHTHIDPITEMRKVAPHAQIIGVEVPGGED